VADVQISIRFRREAGDHAAIVLTGGDILGDDLPDEVLSGGPVLGHEAGNALRLTKSGSALL
jgi:hypothetical protein